MSDTVEPVSAEAQSAYVAWEPPCELDVPLKPRALGLIRAAFFAGWKASRHTAPAASELVKAATELLAVIDDNGIFDGEYPRVMDAFRAALSTANTSEGVPSDATKRMAETLGAEFVRRTTPPEVSQRGSYAALGETSVVGPRWYIYRRGSDGRNYIGGDIADQKSAEAIADELNALEAAGGPLIEALDDCRGIADSFADKCLGCRDVSKRARAALNGRQAK